jgi:SAM-dependent methyltransferase
VDRLEDVTAIRLPDESAGTVLCLETFEHVFEVRRAFDEVARILRPGGVFVLTAPLNFRIHGYPDDYWRMTPNCLRRLLEPYAARLTGSQGYRAFPHTVMGLAIKAPLPEECPARLAKLVAAYSEWGRRTAASRPVAVKLRRLIAQTYRSKGERRQVADYYATQFVIDLEHDAAAGPGQDQGSPIHTAA